MSATQKTSKKKLNALSALERDHDRKSKITPEMLAALRENDQNSDSFEAPSFLLQGRKEFTIFSRVTHEESREIPEQIQSLAAEIRQEIASLKKSNKALVSEIEEVEKQMMTDSRESQGLYHVQFLESVLSYLRNLGAKVSEGRTWLAAMQTKKAKRGSLFGARAKNKGTQYSMSQELQNARSVM